MQRAILLICHFISDRIYSWQKVPEAGSFRTTSCIAQFMCMETDSLQCVTCPGWSRVQYITWSLWSLNISRHFFKTSQFSINFPSCRIRQDFTVLQTCQLIFPSHQNIYIFQCSAPLNCSSATNCCNSDWKKKKGLILKITWDVCQKTHLKDRNGDQTCLDSQNTLGTLPAFVSTWILQHHRGCS